MPERLHTDAGKEFLNKKFQNYLATKNVKHSVTYNETKAQQNVANQNVAFFQLQNSQRYVDVLPKLLTSYKKSYHRSIRTAPGKVADDNAQKVWKRLYSTAFAKRETKERFNFKVGDWVRVVKKKRTFENRAYVQMYRGDFVRC